MSVHKASEEQQVNWLHFWNEAVDSGGALHGSNDLFSSPDNAHLELWELKKGIEDIKDRARSQKTPH